MHPIYKRHRLDGPERRAGSVVLVDGSRDVLAFRFESGTLPCDSHDLQPVVKRLSLWLLERY